MVPIDPTKPISFTLKATDAAGNARTVDPIVVTLERDGRRPVVERVVVGATERWVEVRNGAPGLNRVTLVVNGQRFRAADLRDKEVRTSTSGRRCGPASNRVTLRAQGQPGGSATVVLDGLLLPTLRSAYCFAPQHLENVLRHVFRADQPPQERAAQH